MPNHSHSIVASVRVVCSRDAASRPVRLMRANPNHFVITAVITNHRNSGTKPDSCDYSPAITPSFMNGSNSRWFAKKPIWEHSHLA